uniref:Putative salivary scp/antigen 5 protein n=1 Tax=Panstrongylus lignarius TaxID=156445 RepID=A0A224XJA0_9HEMI
MAKTHCHLVFSLLALAMVRSLSAKCANANQLLGMKELTEKDKKALLEIHNKFRQLAASGKAFGSQPRAQNMLELTWDEHAARQAYDWASKCQWEHNQPKDENDNSLGQNLASKGSTKQLNVHKTFDKWMKGMVRAWYNEVNLYEFGSAFSAKTGHYTQLVWATTAKLGCGYSYYKEIDGGTTWYTGYLVCNYNPAGNWNEEDPYVTGNQNCSGFGLVKSKNYGALCVKKGN